MQELRLLLANMGICSNMCLCPGAGAAKDFLRDHGSLLAMTICIVGEVVMMNVNVAMVNVMMMIMRCGFLFGGVVSCIADLSGSL
jgi:hypothetical protein